MKKVILIIYLALIDRVVVTYHLRGKDFYIGGFSIGGVCVVKYAELAVKENYPIKPKTVFAVDPPLDWERFYNAAKRVVRLSDPNKLNDEVTYIIGRIEKEMNGIPATAPEHIFRVKDGKITEHCVGNNRYAAGC